MEQVLPTRLPVTFTSNWNGPFDGHDLTLTALERAGYRLFPWQVTSDNPWWGRPLKYGEIGCTLAHLACWKHAIECGTEPFIVIFEDDVILCPGFVDQLLIGLSRITAQQTIDLLYLGRFPLEPDQPALSGVVKPGYSHCTFGYLLSRAALGTLLAARLESATVPIDEFLPALYCDHPRPDLRARFPRQLDALAFDPPLVTQLPKQQAGSDTEDSDFVEQRWSVRLRRRRPVSDQVL